MGNQKLCHQSQVAAVPFSPTLSLCAACCNAHSWFLHCLAISHISSLKHPTTHEHSHCLDRLLHSFSLSLSQLLAAFGCIVYQKCSSSSWAASSKQQKHPLESSKVTPPLLNSPKQRSHSLQHIHHWVKEIPPTNAIKCLPEGNIISTCSTNIIKNPKPHTGPIQTWLEDFKIQPVSATP